MNDAMEEITCCITNWGRPRYLNRALNSIRAAGFKRVAIGCAECTPEIDDVIATHKDGWLSFDVIRTASDVGTNSTWALAAYASRTDRVLLLHNDDFCCPNFAEVYTNKLAPMMDAGCGFVCWRANHLMDDGSVSPTEWFNGPTRVIQGKEIERLVGKFGTLSLSPIVGVLNRTMIIRAAKEAEATLTHNDCLERPGMTLGTEILCWIRTAKQSPTGFFWAENCLTHYGHHAGSGTVKHESGGTAAHIIRGYDRARTQAIMHRAPTPKPKIIFVHAPSAGIKGDEEILRLMHARWSWEYQFSTFDLIERAVPESELKRSGKDVGDRDAVPFVRDMLDLGCDMALAEDIVVFCNSDIGLTTDVADKIIAGVERGRGVTVCPRRSLTNPRRGRLYKTVKNCKADGGMDLIAVSPNWWQTVGRDAMPDMLIGREAWDLCFRTLAEEWADGPAMKSTLSVYPEEWKISRAYTDDVCWHEPHASFWKTDRAENKGGAHNRRLARDFFGARKNILGVQSCIEPQLIQLKQP